MRTTKYFIKERKWSGNVLQKEVKDEEGKLHIIDVLVTFNKDFDPIIEQLKDNLNKELKV